MPTWWRVGQQPNLLHRRGIPSAMFCAGQPDGPSPTPHLYAQNSRSVGAAVVRLSQRWQQYQPLVAECSCEAQMDSKDARMCVEGMLLFFKPNFTLQTRSAAGEQMFKKGR